MEDHQRALHLRAQRADDVLLAVKVDLIDDQVLERRVGHELAEDRTLLGAGRAPGRRDVHEDGLALVLGGRKRLLRERGLGGRPRDGDGGHGEAKGERSGGQRFGETHQGLLSGDARMKGYLGQPRRPIQCSGRQAERLRTSVRVRPGKVTA